MQQRSIGGEELHTFLFIDAQLVVLTVYRIYYIQSLWPSLSWQILILAMNNENNIIELELELAATSEQRQDNLVTPLQKQFLYN